MKTSAPDGQEEEREVPHKCPLGARAGVRGGGPDHVAPARMMERAAVTVVVTLCYGLALFFIWAPR